MSRARTRAQSSASSSSVLFQYTQLPSQVLTLPTFPGPKHNSQSGSLIKPCCKSSGHVWKRTFPKVTAFLKIGDLFTQIYLIYFSATELQISIDNSQVETSRLSGKVDYLGAEASYPGVISAFHSLLLLLLESDFSFFFLESDFFEKHQVFQVVTLGVQR